MNVVKLQQYVIDGDARIIAERAARCAAIDALAVDRRHVPALTSLLPTTPEALKFESWLAEWNDEHVGPRLVWRYIVSGQNPPWRWSWPWNMFPEPWIASMSEKWMTGKGRA